MDLRTLINNYLKETKLMQLATAINNQPWVCNVWFVSDDDLNIYWFSSITRRHSDEVLNNNKVAGAIVIPQNPNDPPRGLQFQGVAELLEDEEEINKARSLYQEKILPSEKIDEFMSHKEKPHKFYKIKPSRFVLFDVVNFPENSRQEYNL